MILLTALALPAGAAGATAPQPTPAALGTLMQLPGKSGCLVDLAYKHHKRTRHQERQYKRLRRTLARVERTRLQPLT